MFVQELLLSTLTEQLQLTSPSGDPFVLLDTLQSPKPQASAQCERASVETPPAAPPPHGAEEAELSPAASSKDGVGGAKSDELSKSKSAGPATSPASNAQAGKSGASCSTAGSSSGRPGQGLTSPVQAALQVESWGSGTGASASGSGVGSPSPPPMHHNLPPNSRPPLVAAAMPLSPSPPQPQGSTVNLNEHAMSMHPASQRQAGAMSPRDAARLNPAAAKRSMLKHLPASRGANDMDPPPH
jgi:hypothetical protein